MLRSNELYGLWGLDTGDFVREHRARAVSSWQLSSFSSIWDVSNGSVATPEPVTGDLVTA